MSISGSVSISAGVLRRLAKADAGRFIAFGDTRRMVEQLVMALKRYGAEVEDDEDGLNLTKTENYYSEQEIQSTGSYLNVLPYRAGYETIDRNNIQKSLAKGKLQGVVSTSALELGIDIGEIDLIVLLNQPASMKAFWQRIGRGGRKSEGICLFIDNRGSITDRTAGAQNYIRSPVEPNWLYLDNRYIQYANALCAAVENSEYGASEYNKIPFESLPTKFNKLLENEINPTEIISSDLYPLKQRAQAGPHREFPMRTSIEKSFQVLVRGVAISDGHFTTLIEG
jgi:DEAD/DEAH box helicase domain-containing protein